MKIDKRYLTFSVGAPLWARAATTGPGTLATDFEDGSVHDGVTLATGDLLLIKDQAATEENGLYIVQLTGAPIRSEDLFFSGQFLKGVTVIVLEGTANNNVPFYLQDTVAVVNTDPVVFESTPSSGGSSVGAAGSIQFSDGSGGFDADASNLFWDNTNNRIGIGTNTPSFPISLSGQAASTVGMERHQTANSHGNNLTVQAGGGTSGANNRNGGELVLSSGTSTGTGTSTLRIRTAASGVSGATDNTPSDRVVYNQFRAEHSVNVTPTGAQSIGQDSLRWQSAFFGSSTTRGMNFDQLSSPAGQTVAVGVYSVGTNTLSIYTQNTAAGSGSLYLETGNASAGNSGGIVLQSGTASGTRGGITLNGSSITTIGSGIFPNNDDVQDIGNSFNNYRIIYGRLFLGSNGTPSFGSDFNTGLNSSFESGSSNTATNVGTATLRSGDILAGGSGLAGSVIIRSGDISEATNNNDTGNITLSIGTTTGGGARGAIRFQDGSEGTAGHVWTSTGTNGEGEWQAASGGGANTALSNLASTAVNADIIPDTDGARFLGSSTLSWASIYVGTLTGSGANPASVNMSAGQFIVTTDAGDLQLRTDDLAAARNITIETNVSGVNSNVDSGSVNITTSNVTGTGNSGGFSVLTGTADSTQTGPITLTTGNGLTSTSSGNLELRTGTATGGGSGQILLYTGDGLADSTASGVVDVRTGAVVDTSNSGFVQIQSGTVEDGTSGAVSIRTGAATGSGTRGNIDLDAAEIWIQDSNSATAIPLRFYDADNSNYTALKANDTTTASVTYNLPPSDGSIDSVLGTDGSGNLDWKETDVWVKTTVDYDNAAFTVASTTGTAVVVSIPVRGIVKEAFIKTSVAFTGGTISALTADVGGTTAGVGALISGYDLLASVSNTNYQFLNGERHDLWSQSFGTSESVDVTLNATGDNLDQLTAGQIEIWVKYSKLP